MTFMVAPDRPARWMVTGAEGFVGGFIPPALAASGLPFLYLPQQIRELRDPEEVCRVCAEAAPDFVIHLAAQSFVQEAFKDPRSTLDINLTGTLNLLQALKDSGFSGRLLFVSSGDVYGLTAPEALPVREERALKPRNPYAVSKVAAEALCYQWSQTEGMDIVIARPFNHIGPRQSAHFAISDFARQVVEIKLGRRAPEIHVGDIDTTRDFTDVRDVVRAYLALLEKGERGGIYNICSGTERSIRAMLRRLLELAGVDADICQDAARMRPAEQRRMVGSPERLQTATGWQAQIALDDSLNDILTYWEQELQHG